MGRVKYELLINHHGCEILLMGDERDGSDMEVWLYVGNMAVPDYIRVESVLTILLDKWREEFRLQAVGRKDFMSLAKSNRERKME